MLNAQNLTLHFGDHTLFEDINFLVNPGERVGLVGPNGAGKSTLLKIIAGEIEPDGGELHLSKASDVGYLPQDGVEPHPGLTVLEEVRHAFREILELEEEVRKAQHALADTEEGTREHRSAMDRYGRLQTRLEQSDAYNLEADIEKVLMGLGFSPEDFKRPTSEFSGGWLMRIALAKLLLRQPTYLLLDEPTNHLDIEALQWMEEFLLQYDGAIILVSHDRAFLNTISGRTLALEHGRLFDYDGNYTYFEEKHAERMEHLRQAWRNQQREIKQIQEFIDKFRYNASKAAQVQSRIKQLEKMDRIELEEEQEEISFEFPAAERSGAIVMRLENVRKTYGDNVVFEDLNYTVERGNKLAVVGPNGAGKSTLIRIMAGEEPIDSGLREPGHNVQAAYFAQHQADELDPGKEALEVMRAIAPYEPETRLRTILGCFLFQGDDVFKKVSMLSGGEKSRLALARILLMPANFLIFDEPTNHLDMQSKEILQQALRQYEGSYMIVSHDRDFLDPIVDKTLEVQPEGTRTFLGNVSYYLEKKKEEEGENIYGSDRDGTGGPAGGSGGVAQAGNGPGDGASGEAREAGERSLTRKEERRIEAEKRKKKSRRLKPIRSKIDSVEQEIEKLEKRQQEIEEAMAEPDFYDDTEKAKEVSQEYDAVKQKLTDRYSRWEELAVEAAEIEEEFEV
ncbi:MAG: ABC-F family ATP-binding cassette domain-containing protein [Balneolaceae bacterium]|nr:ABC-F family ATP-binding cassette domain-containing protein [Balneolaceae bacterium]